MSRRRTVIDEFIDPPACTGSDARRQFVQIEKARVYDLQTGNEFARLEIHDEIEKHMVATKFSLVRIDSDQLRHCRYDDCGFLLEFPRQPLDGGFSSLHTAAGKRPALRKPGLNKQ